MPHRRKSLKEGRGQAWPTGAHGCSEVLAVLQGCCRGCSTPTARGSSEPDSPLWQRPLSPLGWWDLVSKTQIGCSCILPQNSHWCYYLEEQYYHQKVNNLKFHKLNSLKTPEIIIDFHNHLYYQLWLRFPCLFQIVVQGLTTTKTYAFHF